MESTTTTSSQTRRIRRRLTEAKDRYIEALANLYCGTAYDIARYRFHAEPTESQERATRYALQLLRDHNGQRLVTWRTYKEFASNGKIFGLTPSGVHYAQNALGLKEARRFENKDTFHEHLITECHLSLREFAEAIGYSLVWGQPKTDFKHRINPDAIAKLTSSVGKLTYCIEPERQTFGENFLKKAKKYRDCYGTPEAEALFGSAKFRVIFIVLSKRRQQTVLEEFEKEYAHRMFWITTADEFRENPGGAIFKTPKDYRERSYSFQSA